MPASDRLCALLGVDVPLFLAPMAGGPSTPALAAAVSSAGGLGWLGCAYSTPEQILDEAREVRRRTDRPFGINLFAPGPVPVAPDPSALVRLLAPLHAELGLAPPAPPTPAPEPFDVQLDAVLESGASAFSVTFGIPTTELLERLRRRGVRVFGTATTVDEGRRLEAAGVDGILAQGSEAGGHRGTFAEPWERGLVGTMALVPQLVDAVSLPVVAAGGIMDGRGWVAAEALGAAGVQLGTAFLLADEAGTNPAYRAALRGATEDATIVTRAFSGRPARGLANTFARAAESTPDAILPFPLQNAATRPLRTAAARAGRAELLSLWAGQGLRMLQEGPAASRVRWLVEDAARVRRDLATGAGIGTGAV